jgi:hypothetical protein
MPTYSNATLDAMLADCNEWETDVVCAAFTARGVRDGGKLRASKPYRKASNEKEGCANYVWRMLCFDLVGSGKHACMPVCADFDLHTAVAEYADRDERWEIVKDLTVAMNELIKRVEAALPIEAHAGVLRWGRALGMV